MFKRLRRVRLNPIVRNLVEETSLRTEDLIYPLFITHGEGIKNAIPSMPDVYQLSIDNALKECEELERLGIEAIMLFGIPAIKDSVGSEALSSEGIIAQALRAIKAKFPNMLLCVDLCFCEYTDHGHCGILNPKLQSVDNDLTLEILNKQALVLAQAGADLIAPSGMMDGMIEHLRNALDSAGFSHIPLMSYSTKFASGYYGPFRDVANSPKLWRPQKLSTKPSKSQRGDIGELRGRKTGCGYFNG